MTPRERAVAFVAEHYSVVVHAVGNDGGEINVDQIVMLSYEKLVQDLAEEFKRMEGQQ